MVSKRRGGKPAKPTKPAPAPSGGAGPGAVPGASGKSLRLALTVVHNLEPLLEDDARWRRASLHDSLTLLLSSLARLESLQSSWRSVIPQRDERSFARFAAWAASAGVSTGGALRVGRADGEPGDNATLYAVRDIDEGAEVLSVPARAMLTSDVSPAGAAAGAAADFVGAMPTLRRAPSLRLAVNLLCEALAPASPFREYIDVLPARFSTPFALPFTAREVFALGPSPAAEQAARTVRSQALTYVKMYRALAKRGVGELCVENFSYANFRWAVSVAMTRQNSVARGELGPVLALIPVWDMCNHAPGKATTSVVVDPSTGAYAVECTAMRRFAEGDAITINYGERGNSELLNYSGFVQAGNPSDWARVEVPFSLEEESAIPNRVRDGCVLTRGGVASVSVAERADGQKVVVGRVDATGRFEGDLHLCLRDIARRRHVGHEVDDVAVKKLACVMLCRSLESAIAAYGFEEANDGGDDSTAMSGELAEERVATAKRLIAEMRAEDVALLRRAKEVVRSMVVEDGGAE